MEKVKFYLTNRFLLLLGAVILFLSVHTVLTGTLLPTTETKNLWFYSGLFMVLFSILFIEPYYSSPKNVLTNTIPLLLVLIAIQQTFKSHILWLCLMGLVLVLMILSILVIALSNKNESPDSFRNSLSDKLRYVAVTFGQGKVLYSTMFVSIIFLYQLDIVSTFSESYLLSMVVLWGLVLLINPKKLHNQFSRNRRDKNTNAIGEIFSVQSNNMFLVRLFSDRKMIKKFDLVRFRYSLNDQVNLYNEAFIFDTYNLNHERWAKVLPLGQKKECESYLKLDTVYKVSDTDEKIKISKAVNIDGFVGVVTEGTKIGRIYFDYSKKSNDLQEGDLLEAQIGNNRVFYQVIGGLTFSENLENKNKSGSVQGEAIQLGIWNNYSISFEKFGWLPEINTPLFKANTENIKVEKYKLPDYMLGTIPGTNLPSVINLDEAISHHTALLGVTGAGKSFLALEMIKQIKKNTKVICIDFTGEWKKKMSMLSLDEGNIHSFLTSDGDSVGIIELPVVSNTVKVIESTEKRISQIFDIAKKQYDDDKPIKVCLILEEAHTIVPEGNFIGVNDWDSKAVVNKIGQVALQGRKFGVGLFIIGQRTANISKTVLTQCNTIICFQAFDETSFNFLGNYIGKDLVQTLPNLKKYHAIVTGKAIKSNIPMIVDLERNTDKEE